MPAGDFSLSTQARHWMFSEERLRQLRHASSESARQKLQSTDAGSSELTPLGHEEENELRAWYEGKLQEVCREENSQDAARFTDRVMSASLMYFKRFFLRVSLMEEDPGHVMLASFLLAGKVEEERIEPDDLLPKYSKIKLDALLALELRLLEVLQFQLVTVSPFRALQGFLQDLQQAAGGGASMQALQQLHSAACAFIRSALCTDAPFLFTPQQLALAGLQEAGAGVTAEGGGVDVAGWLGQRFRFLEAPDGADGEADAGLGRLRAQLDAVRASVHAAAEAPQPPTSGGSTATEPTALLELDARRKQVCKALKGAAARAKSDAEQKAKRAEDAAHDAENALQQKRRKHEPHAAGGVKPEPA